MLSFEFKVLRLAAGPPGMLAWPIRGLHITKEVGVALAPRRRYNVCSMNALTRPQLAVLITAALLTIVLLAALLDVSLHPLWPTPDSPLPLAEVAGDGPWAGWWLDEGWSVGADGALVGDTSRVRGYPLENHHLRYAFAPGSAPDGDYRVTLNLALARGTLYLGVRAAWHPARAGALDCGALVFPLNNRLTGMVMQVSACRMAGVMDPAAGLERPRLDLTEFEGLSRPITVIVQDNRAQLILRDTVIYDVPTPRDRGSLYLALAPQTEVRVASLTWEALP